LELIEKGGECNAGGVRDHVCAPVRIVPTRYGKYDCVRASGAGRSTVVGMTGDVLEAAGLTDLKDFVRWGSAQALFQLFASNPWGLEVRMTYSGRLRLLLTPA